MPANRDERLQLMLSSEEMQAVDDFRFRFRLPSRAAAVRELMKRGLASPLTGKVDKGSRSKDFGVTTTSNGSGFRPVEEPQPKTKNARKE